MISGDDSNPPDNQRQGESENSPVDRKVDAKQRQYSESAYRRYGRKIREKLQQITHEQHLTYGTWALALGTWVLAVLAYCALRDNQSISIQGQRAWVGPNQADFKTDPVANTEAILIIQYQNTGRVPALSVSATGD